MQDNSGERSQFAGERKSALPLSRIVLLVLLVGAIGLLAMDRLHGRMPRDQAYNQLIAVMPEDEDKKPKETAAASKHAISKDFVFWTTDKVHELLNRTPDKTAEEPAPNHVDSILTETYQFRGAFKTYLLLVIYDKWAHVAVGGPKATISSVRRMD